MSDEDKERVIVRERKKIEKRASERKREKRASERTDRDERFEFVLPG